MINRSPMLCILLVIFLLSLFGMPGLGGFMGKMYLMVAMANAGGTVGAVPRDASWSISFNQVDQCAAGPPGFSYRCLLGRSASPGYFSNQRLK